MFSIYVPFLTLIKPLYSHVQSYELLSRVPESERVQVAVIEQTGRIAYLSLDCDQERQ